MFNYTFCLALVCLSRLQLSAAVWTCSEDEECSSLQGSICVAGSCLCPQGQQEVERGTRCAPVAPYYTSPCVEDHQCSRLLTSFQCLKEYDEEVGTCRCLPGHHYFLGRCWATAQFGQNCSAHEQCFSEQLRDPFSLRCDTTCDCAEGYYIRQRGECRRIAASVGEECVLNEDCQFEYGACDTTTLTCYNSNEGPQSMPPPEPEQSTQSVARDTTGDYFAFCDTTTPCPSPLQCSPRGLGCVCPVGYFWDNNGTCLAELGSPASQASQCTGLLAVIRDGICTCPANFYFDLNMRDCLRATRRLEESCVSDWQCYTFGAAARCGAPRLWGLRSCECDPQRAVWDAARDLCRLFVGVGEVCEEDSDCLAGELEIQCVADDEGQRRCTCPEGFLTIDGLCVTTGLELGDACQLSMECTVTANTVCEGGRCSCDSGYREEGGQCAPTIGGSCTQDGDCVIADTVCVAGAGAGAGAEYTCQCASTFIEHEDYCWQMVLDPSAPCNVSAQCSHALGAAECTSGHCRCLSGHHLRDNRCWPHTGLFESCSRSSQCYLGDISERVVCRNSLCQCDFEHPYSELQHTCTSAAWTVTGGVMTSLALIVSLLT